jgi:DNA-binding NarL/FixJ family response regulator
LIRVAILAPALALRIGLREVLRGLPDVEVLAESGLLQGLPVADVWVLTSADFIAELDPEKTPPLLFLTDRPDDVGRLAGLPVWGALPLDASAEELSAAIHALAEGLWVGSPALVQSLLDRQARPLLEQAEQVINPLTERERQVLQLTAQGLANKQIASQLEISENTVKFHLSSLYAKLGVTSRTEAVRSGARRGWVVL